MENLELNKLNQFTTEYNKARIKPRETLWSKALLISPLFSSSANLLSVCTESDELNATFEAEKIQNDYNLKSVVFTKNSSTIFLGPNDLAKTQYDSIAFHGYPLNTGYHYDFLNYMVEILHDQFSNYSGLVGQSPSTVMVDINVMMRHLGLDTKSKTFYKEVFYDLNNRLYHSTSTIVMNKANNGKVIKDRYVYKFEYDEDKNVFTTVFGDIFIDSIANDNWKVKFDYRSLKALKGATRQLYLLLQGLARNLENKNSKLKLAELFVSTAIKTMGLTGSPKTNVETLNDALKHLTKIGYINKVVDDKQSGRSVVWKNVYLNMSFDLKEFADKVLGSDISQLTNDIEAEYTIIDKTEFMPTPVESTEALTTEQHVANIILTWGQNTLTPIASKASNPEQAVDVAPDVAPVVEIEIDPWDVEPDFEAWEREAAEPHRAMKDYNGPYKQWPDDEIYSEFDE